MTFDWNYRFPFVDIYFRLTLPSDPYVRIDLNTVDGDINLDSVLTKTKKKVRKIAPFTQFAIDNIKHRPILQTLNPVWNEEFIFKVKAAEHKLVLQVFDENRLTRDDFLGMVEIPLANLPKEQENRAIAPKSYPLRPRRSVGYVFNITVNLHIIWSWVLFIINIMTLLPKLALNILI